MTERAPEPAIAAFLTRAEIEELPLMAPHPSTLIYLPHTGKLIGKLETALKALDE